MAANSHAGTVGSSRDTDRYMHFLIYANNPSYHSKLTSQCF
jgi:hypothetical protein